MKILAKNPGKKCKITFVTMTLTIEDLKRSPRVDLPTNLEQIWEHSKSFTLVQILWKYSYRKILSVYLKDFHNFLAKLWNLYITWTNLATGAFISSLWLAKFNACIPISLFPEKPRRWQNFNSLGGTRDIAKWNSP